MNSSVQIIDNCIVKRPRSPEFEPVHEIICPDDLADEGFSVDLGSSLNMLLDYNCVAIVLRKLFDPKRIAVLSQEDHEILTVGSLDGSPRNRAPIAYLADEGGLLLPDRVTMAARRIHEFIHGGQNRETLLGFNGELFGDGSIGPHDDGIQDELYGPTVHVTFRGERSATLALNGLLTPLHDKAFAKFWRCVPKVAFEINAGDMVLFYGFHDRVAGRESTPHCFDGSGLSIVLDRIWLMNIDDESVKRVRETCQKYGHNVLARLPE